MKLLGKCVLLVALAAAIGCGKDAVSDSNKNLKPIDPNAPKPAAAGTGSGSPGTPAPKANEGVAK